MNFNLKNSAFFLIASSKIIKQCVFLFDKIVFYFITSILKKGFEKDFYRLQFLANLIQFYYVFSLIFLCNLIATNLYTNLILYSTNFKAIFMV